MSFTPTGIVVTIIGVVVFLGGQFLAMTSICSYPTISYSTTTLANGASSTLTFYPPPCEPHTTYYNSLLVGIPIFFLGLIIIILAEYRRQRHNHSNIRKRWFWELRTKVVMVGLVFLVLGILVFAYSSTHSWNTLACSAPCVVQNGTTISCYTCPTQYPISNLQVQSIGFFLALFGAIVLVIGVVSKRRWRPEWIKKFQQLRVSARAQQQLWSIYINTGINFR